MKPSRFAHASASRSGQDRWAAGSTTSSTCSRRASTRRARSVGMFEPPCSSAIGWISRTSRRPTSTRRWSVGSSAGCLATVLDAPERSAVGGRRRRPSAGCTPVGHGRRYAAALLAECAGTPTPDWSRLTVPTIAAFVQARAERLGPSARRNPGTATRAFLRFLSTRGVISAAIEGAVPTIREWKHAALPARRRRGGRPEGAGRGGPDAPERPSRPRHPAAVNPAWPPGGRGRSPRGE